MFYLSVGSRSSTLGCMAPVQGGITPGDILVCDLLRNMTKVTEGTYGSNRDQVTCTFIIQNIWFEKALNGNVMMTFHRKMRE